MPATVRHILNHVLISQSLNEEDGVITLVRPDFSMQVKSEAIKPNGSPARVELDMNKREIRVWIDDRTGQAKPNRCVKNAIAQSLERRKVKCVLCGQIDIEEFHGGTDQAWGQNGWRIEDGKPVCPKCAAAAN